MSSITIYDSEGHKYENGEQTVETNERIKQFFFAQLRLAVKSDRSPQLVCFFRARLSQTGRSEQFYATFEGRNQDTLFEDFRRNLERTLDDWGMVLDTSNSDTYVFNNLSSTPGRIPGDEFDHEVISSLLNRGEKLQFAVKNENAALSLLKKYARETNRKWISIGERGRVEGLEEHHIVFNPDGRSGLQPLGKTDDKVQTERQNLESRLVDQKLSNIVEEVRGLQQDTTLGDEEIKRKLQRKIPVLSSPQPKSVGNPAQLGNSGENGNDLTALAKKAGVILIAIIVVLGVLTTGLMFAGVALPDVPLIGGDGEDTEDGAIAVDYEIDVTDENSFEVAISLDDGETLDDTISTDSEPEVVYLWAVDSDEDRTVEEVDGISEEVGLSVDQPISGIWNLTEGEYEVVVEDENNGTYSSEGFVVGDDETELGDEGDGGNTEDESQEDIESAEDGGDTGDADDEEGDVDPTVVLDDQTISEDGTISITDVTAPDNHFVLVTYENSDGDLIDVGADDVSNFDSEDIEIENFADDGVSGTHTAHLIPDEDASGEYDRGDVVSDETAEAAIETASGDIEANEDEESENDGTQE